MSKLSLSIVGGPRTMMSSPGLMVHTALDETHEIPFPWFGSQKLNQSRTFPDEVDRGGQAFNGGGLVESQVGMPTSLVTWSFSHDSRLPTLTPTLGLVARVVWVLLDNANTESKIISITFMYLFSGVMVYRV